MTIDLDYATLLKMIKYLCNKKHLSIQNSQHINICHQISDKETDYILGLFNYYDVQILDSYVENTNLYGQDYSYLKVVCGVPDSDYIRIRMESEMYKLDKLLSIRYEIDYEDTNTIQYSFNHYFVYI